MKLDYRRYARLVTTGIAIFCLVAGLSFAAEPVMHAHFIDVGQGASTLLEFPCGAVLIDTGAQDQEHVDKLITYLSDFFSRRKDLNGTLAEVIITHPHIDHTMGLQAVAEKFKITNYVDDGKTRGSGKKNPLWIRKQVQDGKLATKIREVWDDEIRSLPHKHGLTDKIIDPLQCDDCDPKIVILSGGMDENPGWSKRDFENLNNHSLVTRVDFGDSSFLFTGDLEAPAIDTLVTYYRSTSMLNVDLYQVGHHGSYNGTTAAFLEAATPKIALISCGEWDFGKGSSNPFTTFAYGHPRYVTIELLNNAIVEERRPAIDAGVFLKAKDAGTMRIDKQIYCTGWDGTITVDADLHGKFHTHVEPTKPHPPNELKIPEPEPSEHSDE
jgi:beta-lactamase superfamily II metal-dependent hydrolase